VPWAFPWGGDRRLGDDPFFDVENIFYAEKPTVTEPVRISYRQSASNPERLTPINSTRCLREQHRL
jgi:hypothetical protein